MVRLPPPRDPGRRGRATLPTLLLAATLALTGVLAYQAWDAAHSQRAAASRTLHDYAELAAHSFALHAKDILYSGMATTLARWGDYRLHEIPVDAPPAVPHCGGRADAPTYFKYSYETGRLYVSDRCLSRDVRLWLRDTLISDAARHAAEGPAWNTHYVFADVRGVPQVLVFTLKTDSLEKPWGAHGFVRPRMPLAQMAASRIVAHTPLLPPSIMRGAPNEAFLSLDVTDASGNQLYRSAHQYPHEITGQAALPDAFGGLIVRAALDPSAAGQLVIGGLPRSRLPLLAGLFLLAVGMVAIAVRQLRREAELNRLRSDFIANVSHELRTPLAQIRMFAETLLLGRVRTSEEGERSLQIIDQEARRLTHLVENVLQFSRAERRRVRLSPELVDLTAEIRDTVECFAPLARARGNAVETALDPEVLARVDRGAVRQLLTNLLDNAVKYGPQGQRVRVGLASQNGTVRLSVEDEGPGIAREERERIWEPFFRLKEHADSAVAGSGIGLAVVRELATLHGGRAWVESREPRGSRFLVELPREPRPAENGASGETKAPAASTHPPVGV